MISHRAIEAATKAFIEYGTLIPALKAAAPHMQAGAWGDGLQYAYEEGHLTRPQLEALQAANPHRSAN
jgi:hypothetical protein